MTKSKGQNKGKAKTKGRNGELKNKDETENR